MKINFYLRLFFTFLLFAISITAISFYFNNKYIILSKIDNDRKILFSQISYKSELINQSLDHMKHSIKYLLENKKLADLSKNDFEDQYILDVKYFNIKNDLEKLKTRDYFIKLHEYKINDNIYYELFNNKYLYVIYKDKKGLLEIKYDVSALFKTDKYVLGIYNIFDKNGLYLFDIGHNIDIDSFNKRTKLKDIIGNISEHILKFDSYASSKIISKKIIIANKFEFLVLSLTNENIYYDYYKMNYDKDIIFLAFIILLISFVLSIIFSNPASSLYKKITNMNDELSNLNQKNEIKLSESLNIINENILMLKTNLYDEITDVSNAICEFTKYTKNELIGQNNLKFLDPKFVDEELDDIWRKIRKSELKTFNLKGINKDGDSFWLKTYVEPIFNDFEEIEGYSYIFDNITEKIKLEELYKNLESKLFQYNFIFNQVHSGIAILNLDGSFIKINEEFSSLFEYTEKQILSDLNFTNLVDEDEKKIQLLLQQMKDIRSIPSIEKIFLDSFGNKIHLEMNLTILPDNKSLVLIVNSLKDKRKQQEINQILENKIKEEVEKSRQKDEIHKLEQIKNAKLTSIGSLAAGITHEINTPLTYIKGSFELMGYDIEDLPDSEIKTRMLEDKVKIEDGLNRIANIVESMREISQKSNETKEVTNIYSTLITVLTMAYNRSKQVAPIYVKDELFQIGDLNKNKYEYFSKVQKQRIEQVWIIIINNALDELVKIDGYENRSLHIEIFNENDEVVVKFADNAGGIPKDILPNIFDPFMSTKEHGGMGVGLNVAKNIVDYQEGSIKAFNRLNGAVFEVRLKMHKEEE